MIKPNHEIGTCDNCGFKGLVEMIGQLPAEDIDPVGWAGQKRIVSLFACVTCCETPASMPQMNPNLNHQRLPDAEYAKDRKAGT